MDRPRVPRRRRTPREVSEATGGRLLCARRGDVAAASRALGVSARTIRRWKARARRGELPPRWGRLSAGRRTS